MSTLPFDTRLLLAPMAGVNDPVFRALCRRMGAGLTYTEMISSLALAYGNRKTQDMLRALPEDRPYAVQLFGSEPAVMAAQARALEAELGAGLALIDINMGCPARKVVSSGNGAALLKRSELACEIVAAVHAAVRVPVTVKMRLVSHADADTLAFASGLAESGAAALTIHGRTAEQYYRGAAHRSSVDTLVAGLSIPVIASGDVFSREDAREYRERGASAVMVARGARGNPWIFSGEEPDLAERVAVAREHVERLHAWEPRKLVWMRKHLAWYFKGSPVALRVRKAVQTAVSLEDYLALLESCAVGGE
ncbi:MAG: tRNA-dihydrouridine synthase family protein [Coriobacteriales bacterium]|jgi:nifR3 family TIM-barrel protein|nr:tRNA-dihydrouridine synthase family protein [Coriobacteriales bacterium]